MMSKILNLFFKGDKISSGSLPALPAGNELPSEYISNDGTITINAKTIKTEEFWHQNNDILKGYELFVTISPDTPLYYLEQHGLVVANPQELFDVPAQYGIWLPYLGDNGEDGQCASQFGPISRQYAKETAIPFLKLYRRIYENDDSADTKFELLNKLGENLPVWRDLIAVRNDSRICSLGEFWAKKNLMTH